MKELVREITIRYRWWRTDGKPIKSKHIKELEGATAHQFTECICMSRELTEHIFSDASDGEDGIEYTGHWEIKQ